MRVRKGRVDETVRGGRVSVRGGLMTVCGVGG